MPPWQWSFRLVFFGGLILALVVLLFAPAVPAQGAQADPHIPALVDRYALQYGIPQYIARNLVREASGSRQDAVSRSGARGVMQLMPETARALGIDIDNTEQNIEGGMRYLRQQYDRFRRWDLAVAAYHAGPAAVARLNGVPPNSRSFVQRVLDTESRPGSEVRLGRTSPPATAGRRLPDGFALPLQGVLTARFGRSHRGIDLAAPHGTPIRASRGGKVSFSGWYYDYGRTVMIDHGAGVLTLYGHTSANLVRQGSAVRAGEVIARVGCTGRCTGPHVHFEIRVNGRAVDPFREIREYGATIERAAGSVSPSPIASRPAPASRTGSARQSASVPGTPVTQVRDTVQGGQVVRRVETVIISLDDGLRLRITREYRLIDGVLTMIGERTKILRPGEALESKDEEDDGKRDSER